MGAQTSNDGCTALARRQIRCQTVLDDIDLALAESRFPSHLLCIELTEGSLIDPSDESSARLHDIQSRNTSISIDDFGTGYSSMSCLKRLSVNTVKIDRSFVIGLPDDPEDASIVRAVITMAHGLGLRVVVEGVDHSDQVSFLSAVGCDYYQGYYFSRPVDAGRFEELLRQRAKLAALT